MRGLIRFALVLAGALIVLTGVIITPLPGPMGLPVMIVGLAVMLRGSVRFKRWFLRLVVRYPKVLKPVRALLRPRAPFLSIIWHQMLRLERAVLPRRIRGLKFTRRFITRPFLRRNVWSLPIVNTVVKY